MITAKNTITTKCNNITNKLRQKEQAALLQKKRELPSKTQGEILKKEIANPRKKK